ncbi:hypothetical protein M427DRAFT_366295 [Gonapodya prolifera JEL478]|uniref:Uncharacterized protein n=1 Tax=Gonapodya prolifera (strain JEL478) TaxID=1344416 RepID=A0A139AB94_GONPJ|nr:hypothetical protein M427DRAFT_366295 [Gonapodya prolifera JEL478]|eukprot:KXS13663.1 hypothetical protein M427DRAFT_366295 [Gonapodya prolifera JEL478]
MDGFLSSSGGMIALHALFQTLTLALISYVVSQGALSTWSGVVSYDWAFHLALASLVVDVFLLGVQIAGSVVVWYERREYTAIAG